MEMLFHSYSFIIEDVSLWNYKVSWSLIWIRKYSVNTGVSVNLLWYTGIKGQTNKTGINGYKLMSFIVPDMWHD